MSDIFLSYSRDDLARAQQLAEALAAEGWSVWFDPKIRSGAMFDRAIEKAIAEARCVVVLWSKTSVESDWVRSEAGEGLDREILVPVVIEEGVRIPLRYRQVQTVNLSRWDGSHDDPGFARLVDDLRHLLGSAAPAPAVEAPAAARLFATESASPASEPVHERDEAPTRPKPLLSPPARRPSRGWEALLGRYMRAARSRYVVGTFLLLIGLSAIGSVLFGFPLDLRPSGSHVSAAAESAVFMLDGPRRVEGARSMIGEKIEYAAGKGGEDSRSVSPGQKSDDLGFVAWAIGISRWFPPGPGMLEHSTFLDGDLFKRVPAGTAEPGDLYISQSHLGLVTEAPGGVPSRVILCSKANDEQQDDCVQEVDAAIFSADSSSSFIARVDYDAALRMGGRAQ